MSTDSTVAKVFDYGPARIAERQPNIDAWKLALLGMDISVRNVPHCENVCVLFTPLFPGNHVPTHSFHVTLLCDQLSLLHAAEKWHGDVLCQNVLFWVEGDEAKTALIDFDYSYLPEYPIFWNAEFPERHPEAKGRRQVPVEHDVYAAIAILCLHFKFRESDHQEQKLMWEQLADGDFNKDTHPDLMSSWNEKSAKDVAAWIRTTNAAKITPDPLYQPAEEVQTGLPPEKRKLELIT
jgi:hypothetical protein